MLKMALRIPGYWLFRRVGWPRWSPMNLTLSLSFRCNSRCKTCNVYERRTVELSAAEWRKIFQRLDPPPLWVTISGGEPFLYADLQAVVASLYDHCRPAIINIPTNGLLFNRIPGVVREITAHCIRSQIVVNLSIDEIAERHDAIRGVSGNYKRALNTYAALKAIDAPNLTVGLHSVISKLNVERMPQIYEHLQSLDPDSYVTEIAEERIELGTIGTGITPDHHQYAAAVDTIMQRMKNGHFNPVGRIARAFRLQYYQLVKRMLKEQREVIPCYAGIASAQIAPNGDVWMCCTTAECIGNLKEANYDFAKVWASKKACEARRRIKETGCYCPLANASYTNMLFDPKSVLRAGRSLIHYWQSARRGKSAKLN